MELIEAKITAMIALSLGSLIMGLLPVLFTRYGQSNSPLLLSSLLCLGAGVLLSTSLIHMLPEIREDLTGTGYEQYAELILCSGFFILYLIDEFVHLCYKDHGHSHTEQTIDDFPSQGERRHSVGGHHHHYGATERDSLLERQPSYNPEVLRGYSEDSFLNSRSNRFMPSQICHIVHEIPCQSTPTATVSLLVALTIHAVLEGLAVGLENDTSQVLMMLIAVASHKLVVGFCLGTELSSSRSVSACQYFVALILFSFGSALGIGLGMTISELPKSMPKLLLPILQGLAGGTLLYVTVCEVLPRERADWHKKSPKIAGMLQLSMTAVGFAGMTVLIHFAD